MFEQIYVILHTWFILSNVWAFINAWLTYRALAVEVNSQKYFAYAGYEYIYALAFLPAFIFDFLLRKFFGYKNYTSLTLSLVVDKDKFPYQHWRIVSVIFQSFNLALVGIVSVADIVF